MRIARESRWLAAICAADLVTTLWFVYGMGAQEANPLMQGFLSHGIAAFVVAKTALVIGPLAVIEWARRHRPRFAHGALRACIALYLISYGSVVWRINADAQEPQMSAAEVRAIESHSSAPVTRDELAQRRLELASFP